MDIELVPCYGDRALFMKMAKEYVETLHKHDPKIVWDKLTWEKAVWDARFILEGRTIQGFAIVEEVKFALYNDLLYISEFFIEPEARRHGLGIEAVKQLTDYWGGDIFLYVLNNNFEAKAFWMAVEEKLGWKRVWRPEIRQEQGCTLLTFQKG